MLHLTEAFVAPSNLYHHFAINAEVATLQPSVFNPVASRCQLVAEEGFAHGAHLRQAVGNGVEQVAVVEQYFVGFLKVGDAVDVGEEPTDECSLLQVAQVFQRRWPLDADVFRQLGDVDLVGHHLRQHFEQGLNLAGVAHFKSTEARQLAVDDVVHHRFEAALIGGTALEIEGIVALLQVAGKCSKGLQWRFTSLQ